MARVVKSHIDMPHCYFVKDAFTVCVSSDSGQCVEIVEIGKLESEENCRAQEIGE